MCWILEKSVFVVVEHMKKTHFKEWLTLAYEVTIGTAYQISLTSELSQ